MKIRIWHGCLSLAEGAIISLLLTSCFTTTSPSPKAVEVELAKNCGWDYVDRVKTIKATQEINLKAAGLPLQEQTRIAANLVKGDTSGSELYITSLGISFADERTRRESFLRLMGRTSAELRQDDDLARTMGSIYTAYLDAVTPGIVAGGCALNSLVWNDTGQDISANH